MHQIIHPPMGAKVSRDFKSSNGIEISWLAQVLLNFDWFQGSPPGGWGGGWMWVGSGERVSPTYVHMYVHAHMHTHTHAHTCDIIGNSQRFPQWGQPFAWNYHVYHVHICMCACACIHMHVYMCGSPKLPPTPIHPPPHPQSRRKPKTPKFNKSWTNWDNSILFEDSLPLNIPGTHIDYSWSPQTPPPTCPTPQSWGNPNQKNYNNSWMIRDNSILFKDLWPLNPPAHI